MVSTRRQDFAQVLGETERDNLKYNIIEFALSYKMLLAAFQLTHNPLRTGSAYHIFAGNDLA
jgi:hypothetical protein